VPDASCAPDFSVIYRLTDQHGTVADTLDCLDSWTRGQSHDRSRYEVIVVSDGANPALDEGARRRLAPPDVLTVRAVPQLFELYTIGARLARGKFLFVVESHSRGHPDCLREMLAYLEAGGYDAASCRIVGADYEGHWLSRLGRRKNDELLAADEAWRRVQIGGSAIRRATYEAVGGFEHEFNKFAPAALSAKLKERGRAMGHASQSVVYHVDSPELGEVVAPIRDYVLGEIAYRSRYPAEYCERFFGRCARWALRGDHRPDLSRRLFGATLRALPGHLRRASTLGALLGCLGRLAPVAALGWRWHRQRTWWLARLAVARAWWWRRDDGRSYAAFEQARRHFEAHFRATALETYFAAQPAPSAVGERLALAEVDPDRLAGFYQAEQRPEGAFRWTKAAAAVEVLLEPGDHLIRLRILPFRPPNEPARTRVYFDGHRLRRVSTGSDTDEVFALKGSMFRGRSEGRHTIVLVCAPFWPSRLGQADARELGLPLSSLTFDASTPAGSGCRFGSDGSRDLNRHGGPARMPRP
jgi:hypothetical protein